MRYKELEVSGMVKKAPGVNWGVLQWVKRSALRCFGHVRRMPEEHKKEKVYQNYVRGVVNRGRPPEIVEGQV